MTDWGDYTPGPWREDDDACIWAPQSADLQAHEQIATVEMRNPDWPANKRLLSKAYLIPRLEAALMTQDPMRRYDALLVELRGVA